MGYKIGLLLSMVFVFSIFALGGDIVSIQIIYSELDSVSMNAGYMISKSGDIEKAKTYVENEGMIFTCNDIGALMYGETISYSVSRNYDPLVIKKENMLITISRSAVVGFYY